MGYPAGPAQTYAKGVKLSLGSNKYSKGTKKRSHAKAEPLSVNISMVGVREQVTPQYQRQLNQRAPQALAPAKVGVRQLEMTPSAQSLAL